MNDRCDFHTGIKAGESHVSMENYFEEVAGAAYELAEEACYAITAISRALVTTCRLVVRAATLVLAVTCLAVAVGVWAWTVGKNL